MADRAQILNDSVEAFRLALEGNQVGIWTALPCIVVSVNLTAMTCELQPAIKSVFEDQLGAISQITLPVLPDVPICFPSAGGFTLTFPIKAGDDVLGVFSSRCIDAWWQSGGVQQAMESRMHDLSDCFAIPGPKSQPKVISAISSTTVQLRNDTGTAYLEVDAGGNINLVGTTVKINGQVYGTHVHSVTTAPGTTGVPT